MHAGHSGKCVTRERFIPIHITGDELGHMFCQSLPSAHALTGCDSTNAFFGVGKKTVFTTLQKQIDSGAVDGLADFGDPDWIEAARKLVLGLHGNKGRKCATLNELCYHHNWQASKPTAPNRRCVQTAFPQTSMPNETLMIISSIGIQISTTFVTGRKSTKLFSSSSLQDIAINEYISMHCVVYCLILLLETSSEKCELYPLFQGTKPRLDCIQEIYSRTKHYLHGKDVSNHKYKLKDYT
ncbi:Phosphatidylinositol N-acetylglucosaminyltransferase subunit H [Nymphon striatum]|nr:Phosphatidylinositol N-acetylglucosaminyltransferase subunit H [Nymphon striatum]